MTINLKMPDITELKPRITVFGVGGAGGNAVNNMIQAGLDGVDFVVANTDAQALTTSKAERLVQMGVAVTEGLGAGSQPEIGRAAAEEAIDEINDHLSGAHMAFITAGMGGGTGTGAAPVIARAAREHGILTVGVVTKPFQFEGQRRMRIAENGIDELQKHVDTLICIPNQNLFRIANEKTTFADAFSMADEVLYSGVACITDLMVKEGLINLDFADVRSVMREMGKAMMGTGEASGDNRAIQAAEAAISNPLLDDVSMSGARGLLISITGGKDMTLFEVDEAATRIREEVDEDANIILGATFDDSLEGSIRVSVVSTGIDTEVAVSSPAEDRMAELTQRLRAATQDIGRKTFASAVAKPVTENTLATDAAVSRVEREIALPTVSDLTPTPTSNDPEVTIKPFVPQQAFEPEAQPGLDPMPLAQASVQEAGVTPQSFIPAEAETPELAQPRMPRVDELPAMVQREIQAQTQDPAVPATDEEGRPLSLLRRLANVGLGRREEDQNVNPAASKPIDATHGALQEPITPAHHEAGQMQNQPVSRPVQEPVNEYAKRASRPSSPDGLYSPQQGSLDSTGRAAVQQPLNEADQLEIPAFLRRQSN